MGDVPVWVVQNQSLLNELVNLTIKELILVILINFNSIRYGNNIVYY